jgi:hypothetical protein
MRHTPAVAPTWDILQTLFGFAFTVQQELYKLRVENNVLSAQNAGPSVKAGYPPALGRIVASAQNLTEASGAAIALGTDHSMTCVARCGVYAPPIGSQLDARSGLSGECVRSRDSVICMNAAADPRVDYKACMALGIRSMVYVPLLRDDRVIGVLAVFSSKPQHFSPRDLNCLRWTDQLISEALHTNDSSEIGAAPLVRTVEFAESETPATPANSGIALVPPRPPEISVETKTAEPGVEIPLPVARKEPVPPTPPTFVGTIVDEALEDEFFRQPEPNPKLAPLFNNPEKQYDSPLPLLVAMLLVVGFLAAVSLITYKRLSSTVTTSAGKPASATASAQPAMIPSANAAGIATGAEPVTKTTPGFPAGVIFQTAGDHAVLALSYNKPITYEGFAIQGPNRVYFDVHGVSLAGPKGTSVPVNHALVSRVRISPFRVGTTRIVFDLKGDSAFQVNVSDADRQLSIDISPKNASDAGAISPKAGEAVKITSTGNTVLHTPALPPYAAK